MRDDFLQTVNNLLNTEPDTILQSQIETNSSSRYTTGKFIIQIFITYASVTCALSGSSSVSRHSLTRSCFLTTRQSFFSLRTTLLCWWRRWTPAALRGRPSVLTWGRWRKSEIRRRSTRLVCCGYCLRQSHLYVYMGTVHIVGYVRKTPRQTSFTADGTFILNSLHAANLAYTL